MPVTSQELTRHWRNITIFCLFLDNFYSSRVVYFVQLNWGNSTYPYYVVIGLSEICWCSKFLEKESWKSNILFLSEVHISIVYKCVHVYYHNRRWVLSFLPSLTNSIISLFHLHTFLLQLVVSWSIDVAPPPPLRVCVRVSVYNWKRLCFSSTASMCNPICRNEKITKR